MKIFCFLRYDNESNIYRVFKQNEDFILFELPRIGEKVVYNIDGIAHISEIIDINHNIQSGGIDIIISKEQKYSDYKRILDNSGALQIRDFKINK